MGATNVAGRPFQGTTDDTVALPLVDFALFNKAPTSSWSSPDSLVAFGLSGGSFVNQRSQWWPKASHLMTWWWYSGAVSPSGHSRPARRISVIG